MNYSTKQQDLLFAKEIGGEVFMTDRIIAICSILLALAYFYATFKIHSLDGGDPLGPKAFPILLGIGLVVTALLLLKETKSAKRQVQEGEEELKEENRRLLLVIGGVVAWTAIFIIVFKPVGYIVSTAFYLFGLMAYFHPKQWWINAITSVLFTVGIYVLFGKVLGVDLASGIMRF